MKDAAFAKCSGLTDVTVHALVPPVIESFHYYPFEDCYDKATLHVPARALIYHSFPPATSASAPKGQRAPSPGQVSEANGTLGGPIHQRFAPEGGKSSDR